MSPSRRERPSTWPASKASGFARVGYGLMTMRRQAINGEAAAPSVMNSTVTPNSRYTRATTSAPALTIRVGTPGSTTVSSNKRAGHPSAAMALGTRKLIPMNPTNMVLRSAFSTLATRDNRANNSISGYCRVGWRRVAVSCEVSSSRKSNRRYLEEPHLL